jgi:hypothetical protein
MSSRRILVGLSSVALFGLVASACGSEAAVVEAEAEVTTIASVVETTVVEAGPINPLLGTEATDEAVLARPAMVVKIDNHPKARPQIGLNQADIVFEENVEGLTRFAAVFHSQGSDPVGPIRSGRFQDINLVGSLNQPLFVWSGGNPQVTTAIRNSDLVDLSYTVANKDGGFARDSSRPAPHNLIAETTKLWTLAPDGAVAPKQQFEYRTESDANASSSDAVDGVRVSMDGVKVQWLWSGDDGLWLRSQDGKPHLDSADVQVGAPNVVVLEVEYSNAYSPTAKTVGSGKAYVFTNGVVYVGSWERTDRLSTYVLRDAAGAVIKLTPGRSFILASRADKVAIIGSGVDPESIKYP